MKRLRNWLIRLSNHYPPRWWWPVVRIYGGPEGQERGDVYMTRIMLGPRTPWGRLYLHVFHRSDVDRDPHDHPFDFWTLPLNQGYIEEVFRHDGQISLDMGDSMTRRWNGPCFEEVTVPRWRWTFRPAAHTHRVDRTLTGRWPLITLVWRSATKRSWGFSCHDDSYRVPGMPPSRYRRFVPWANYVFEGQHANVAGEDVMCPSGAVRQTPSEGKHA